MLTCNDKKISSRSEIPVGKERPIADRPIVAAKNFFESWNTMSMDILPIKYREFNKTKIFMVFNQRNVMHQICIVFFDNFSLFSYFFSSHPSQTGYAIA